MVFLKKKSAQKSKIAAQSEGPSAEWPRSPSQPSARCHARSCPAVVPRVARRSHLSRQPPALNGSRGSITSSVIRQTRSAITSKSLALESHRTESHNLLVRSHQSRPSNSVNINRTDPRSHVSTPEQPLAHSPDVVPAHAPGSAEVVPHAPGS